MHQGESNPPGTRLVQKVNSTAATVLKMRELGEILFASFPNAYQCVMRYSILFCVLCSYSLLDFPMRTKPIFYDIPSYPVLDFPSKKTPLNSKRRMSRKSATRPPFIDELKSAPIDSSGFYFHFHFPIDSIGGQ